jgi:hypothetical protein
MSEHRANGPPQAVPDLHPPQRTGALRRDLQLAVAVLELLRDEPAVRPVLRELAQEVVDRLVRAEGHLRALKGPH